MRRAALALALAALASPAALAKKIDVGGYKLNVRCEGEGAPTVVLDAGAGDTLETWDWVVPEVKRFARVCAYDRAGLGKSDRGPTPRTSARIVVELHALLRRAGILPPYVLVGHSFGGLNMRLYASTYPGEAVGLVLVDATPEEFPSRVDDLLPRSDREKLRTSLATSPAAFRDELDAMAESASEVAAAGPPPAFPVRVLTAAHRDDSEAFRTAWLAWQARITTTFPQGVQILATTSGHYIQFDQPGLVVDAIREVVEAARER
jgi:pimeloyl-ACP methyl ester carboxylesterase